MPFKSLSAVYEISHNIEQEETDSLVEGQGELVLVDPELLRAFSRQVETASSVVTSTEVGLKASTAADGLPGSTTQWAARLVGEHLTQRSDTIAENVAGMGVAVRGAGDRYEVDDNALASQFDGLF
ncbi:MULTISPECIES: hypothetical protein [Mycobacteriaceae]|uniref:hypothetical protein n=1 Tax=Mycobacteriaceae TaxID=1762 RepID=UPI0003730476|nr:hypothetical protein [Mycolicibacterium neoaurum]